MRIVLSIISTLAFAVFVFTFLGQRAAFYCWHNGSMEVRRYYPADQEAARDFEQRIGQSYPRWQEWAVIRGLSGGLFLTALVGFWIERRRRVLP
jgi:hypothetical protein